MKLAVVIVNWNVKELLRRCLASVFLYAPTDEYEVWVVDNASTDGSAGMVAVEFPQVKLIANDKNLGFARANNQAIRQTNAECILLLNPDACVHPDTFVKLLAVAEQHSSAGVIGGKIINDDGSLQPSVRKFPDFWQQFFWSKVRRADPERDTIDYALEQEVDQVMGAFFLIRRAVIERVGLLDEKFFIWMEEVDWCKRVKQAGYAVLYTPEAIVTHQRAASFNQQNLILRQWRFNASCRHYYLKHHGWLPWFVLTILNPISLFGACLKQWRLDLYGRSDYRLFWGVLLAILLCEELSLWSYGNSFIGALGWWGVFVSTLGLALWRLEYGVMVMLVELVIGSKGHLFDLSVGGVDIGVRLGIFCVVMTAWSVHVVKNFLRRAAGMGYAPYLTAFSSRYFKWYAAIGVLCGVGFIRGGVHNGVGAALEDANAWLYFLVLFPIMDVMSECRRWRLIAITMVAGIVAQIVKVFFLLYILSHPSLGPDTIFSIYRWVRESGVGELTQLNAQVFRIFLQSQVYVVIALFIVMAWSAVRWSREVWSRVSVRKLLWAARWQFLLFSALCASFLLSYSRSFWLAGGLVGVGMLAGWAMYTRQWRSVVRLGSLSLAGVMCGVLMILAVTNIPLPLARGFDLGSFGGRLGNISDEAAAASRWALLPELWRAVEVSPLWGQGFGAAVTYFSKDPRVLEQNLSGEYTTTAFEWGYLDIWLKLGFLGLIVYVGLLGVLLRDGWQRMRDSVPMGEWRYLGLWFGLLALMVIHAFTPYLNHPLGIALVLIYSAVLTVSEKKKTIPGDGH